MSGAMLDCAICRTRKWKPMNAESAEELRALGATRLECEGCARETYWLYSEMDAGSAPQRKSPEPPMLVTGGSGEVPAVREENLRSWQTERRAGLDRRNRSRRGQRRVALQLPVRVRVNSLGAQFEDVARTINVCRNGIYFQTERPYSKGLPAQVAMNYSPRDTGPAPEQRGTVVRVDPIAGSTARAVAIQLY